MSKPKFIAQCAHSDVFGNCPALATKRGFCEKHYRRFMRGASMHDEPFVSAWKGRNIPKPHALEIWLAYCAGMLDGEGTICISRGSDKASGKADWIYPRVVVVNSCLDGLRPFQSLWGGNLRSKPLEKAHHKPSFYWQRTGKAAASIALELLPYLQIKRRQAEIIIEFQQFRPFVGRGRPLKQSEIERQDKLRDELKALNKRGLTDRNVARKR